MPLARQLFNDLKKSIKVYPWTLAKLVKVSGGGTVQDYLNGTKKVKKAEYADNTTTADKSKKIVGYGTGANGIEFDWQGIDKGVVLKVDNTENLPMQLACNSWVSDKIRTFDRGNVWHDDRLFYVHEIADGVYQPYVQEPNRVCQLKTKYAENADNLQGYYPLHVIGSYNPAGNDWVVIPCGGRDIQYISFINGNWDACPIRPTSAARQGGYILIFFERAFTGNVQLNIRMFYPS